MGRHLFTKVNMSIWRNRGSPFYTISSILPRCSLLNEMLLVNQCSPVQFRHINEPSWIESMNSVLSLARKFSTRDEMRPCPEMTTHSSRRNLHSSSHPAMKTILDEPWLDRDFFIQLWVVDKKVKKRGAKRRARLAGRKNDAEAYYFDEGLSQQPSGRWFSGASTAEADGNPDSDSGRPVLRQPPPSQPVSGILKPTSAEEVVSFVFCLSLIYLLSVL